MTQTFTKSDLKTGMLVTLADNTYWWVICNVPSATKGKSVNYIREATETDPDFLDLGNYTEDLLWNMEGTTEAYKERFANQHIVKVSLYQYTYDVLNYLNEMQLTNTKVIWERQEPKPKFDPRDLTIDEIYELLGFSIQSCLKKNNKEEN